VGFAFWQKSDDGPKKLVAVWFPFSPGCTNHSAARSIYLL
jgi:hypothetical protein